MTGACADCRHFCAGALALERRTPGLRILSSAFGAVRSRDGLCDVHDRYVPAHAQCEHFLARISTRRD